MSSHIQRLPSGRFRIRWIDELGKRRSETFTSEAAAKSAVKHRHVEVDKVRAGVARPRSDLTILEASKQWIEARKPALGSAEHIARQRNNRVRDNQAHLDRHILPALGHLRLPQVTNEVVNKFIRGLEATTTSRRGEKNEIKRTLKPATIANVIITLRKMMNDLGYPLRISYKVPESDYGWIKSTAQVSMFLDACKTPWFRSACELAVYAGLRVGEVAGLRWDRIDFDRNLIRVDRSYDGPCKNKHVRTVPLAPELAEKLKRWRLATGAASKGFVITIDGEAITPEQGDFAKRTRRACKKAKVDPVTFHQLRHTFASHLAERVSLPVVGAVLGHADPKTTARYAHVDTSALARDPRLHLTFSNEAGKVRGLHESGHKDGHVVDTTPEAASLDRQK